GRCRRAALPELQGDHGGEVEASRRSEGRGPRHRRVGRRMGRCRPRDRRCRQGGGASSRRDRRRRRRGLPEHRCPPRELEGQRMSLSKVWVYAEADGDKVKTITLEMLAKAREIGDTVEAV